jgi:hypothetical protein
MSLPNYTNEQLDIIKSLKKHNVIVDSVAGSGKTTTNLHIAKYYEKKNILLLTYNAKLKKETRDKVLENNIDNLEVHSYHSFCYKYYDTRATTDKGIRDYVINKSNDEKLKTKYNIIILDETQDMTKLYYQLVLKIYKDNNKKKTKLCILGDKNQSIFEFNGADERFITLADMIFKVNKYEWKKKTLSESFRITNTMADFVNKSMLKENRMISNKKTHIKPRYIKCNCFSENSKTSIPLKILKQYLNSGYKPSEIFILAPSVRSNQSPIKKLEKMIISEIDDIQIYIPTSDEEKLNEKVLENKLVFSSFHQVKGLERKVIIIFNFDASYFEYYEKNKPTNKCPNVFYVAATRAKEHLVVLHHCSNQMFEFVNRNMLSLTTDLENYNKYDKKEDVSVIFYSSFKKSYKKKTPYLKTSPTDLTRHLNEKILHECLKFVDREEIKMDDDNVINIDTTSKQIYNNDKTGYENVSEITGLAIPLYYEYKIKGKLNKLVNELLVNKDIMEIEKTEEEGCLFGDIDMNCDDDKPNYNMSEINKNLKNKKFVVEQFLYMCNSWNSTKNNVIFKIKQITDYNWLSVKQLDECVSRLDKLKLSKSVIFEKRFEIENKNELQNRKLVGYCDCIDKNNLYEFKCVKKLEEEHFLQLAIYMYMNEIKTKRKIKMNYYLYNILTNTLFKLTSDVNKLQNMMSYLIDTKYKNVEKKSNGEFIKSILE